MVTRRAARKCSFRTRAQRLQRHHRTLQPVAADRERGECGADQDEAQGAFGGVGEVPGAVLERVRVTMLATGIGFIAISTVGDVLRGSGPLGKNFNIAQHGQMCRLSRRRPGKAPTATS